MFDGYAGFAECFTFCLQVGLLWLGLRKLKYSRSAQLIQSLSSSFLMPLPLATTTTCSPLAENNAVRQGRE